MGSFLAVLPLFAVHMVVILYVTTRLNLNRAMALAIQNLYMPPFVPMVCIELGFFLRHGHWLTEASRQTLLYELPERVWEWLLGSLVVAPLAAAVAWVVVFLLARLWQRKARAHA